MAYLFTSESVSEGHPYKVADQISDSKVAALHLAKLGVELETLRPEQTDYISVAVQGPFKPEYYRY